MLQDTKQHDTATHSVHREKTLLNNPEDEAADLTDLVYEFVERVSRRLLAEFPAVKRWDESDDICQQAAIRLFLSLQEVEIEDRRHLENLAATQIRRTLIDLARSYSRTAESNQRRWTPHSRKGDVNNVLTQQPDQTGDSSQLLEWAELHIQVENLPDDLKEVFQMRWYRGLSNAAVAELLGCDVRSAQRKWRTAREALAKTIDLNVLDLG